MFDVLVESNTTKGQSAKQSAYFGTTFLVLGSLFLALFVYSLYSYNLGGIAGDDLSLDTLVAPVALPDNAPPPPPAPETKPEQKQVADAPKNFDILKDPVESLDNATKVPDKASAEKSTATPVREGVAFKVGNTTQRATGGSDAGVERSTGGGGGGAPAIAAVKPVTEDKDDAPKAPTPKPAPKASVVSGGVINGKASRLVQPPYPAAAKAVRASGTVNVQVLIDEAGNVVSASATSGNPLLRAAAVQAARASKFTPTQLSGQPVKVSGIIVYNFVAQ
jgi:TonB family protein